MKSQAVSREKKMLFYALIRNSFNLKKMLFNAILLLILNSRCDLMLFNVANCIADLIKRAKKCYLMLFYAVKTDKKVNTSLTD